MVKTTNKILINPSDIKIGKEIWIARLNYISSPEGVHIDQDSKIKPIKTFIKSGVNLNSGKGIRKYVIDYPDDYFEIIISENNEILNSRNGLIITSDKDSCEIEYNKIYQDAVKELQEFIDEIKSCFDIEY